MRRDEFTYELPEGLIAQYPPAQRGASRLLCLDKCDGSLQDRVFADLPGLLSAGDLLVFNNTRVIPARLFGRKESGGKVEIMLERVLDERQCLAQLRCSKTPKPGAKILLEKGFELELIGRREDLFILACNMEISIGQILAEIGHMPLPPYIQRADQTIDEERYQTVYAQRQGAVAAPTAGLHFTHEILRFLENQGVNMAYVTLHIGAGTFQPVRTEHIEAHKMHSEYFEVSEDVCDAVNAAKENSKRVIAVGTTSVRCLESAGNTGKLRPYQGETGIFIYPGFEFKIVDAMVTNFHLPESTLLMLVCAFAGEEHVLKAYEHAVAESYRFFSYGDAMFIRA